MPIISTLIFLVLVAVGNFACMLVDKNYNELYGNSYSMSNGVVDFAGCELTSKVDPKLKGEWEFYYNKWLITDDISDRTPDGYLTPYERWTDLTVDGERLPSEGYGSYRILVKNVPPNRKITVRTYDCTVPWRAYINGVLVSSYGEELQKNHTENKIYYNVVHSTEPFITEEGMTYEVIVELSASDDGGQNAPTTIAFRTLDRRETFGYMLYFIPGVTVGVLLLVLILVITYAVSVRDDKSHVSFAFLIVLIILSFFFCNDAFKIRMTIFPLFNYTVMPDLNFWTSIVTLITLFFYLLSVNKLKFSIKNMHAVFIAAAAFTVATIFTHGLSCQYWLYLTALSLLGGSMVFLLAKEFKNNAFENGTYMGILFIMLLFYELQAMDTLNVILWGAAQGYSYLILCITIVITLLYIRRIIQNNKKLVNMMKKDMETQNIRNQVLKAQIKPHFVFNTLTLIKDNYHKSTKTGDTALDMFAKHLRSNLEADMTNCVPFSAEIDNIINYFDLENMKFDGKLSLLLDIECENFSIPPLSLQPIVENSLKYSKVQDKEDGFIQLITRETEDSIIIVIEDNGVGFDPSVKKPHSVGLKNISERLRTVLGATLNIETAIGIGTKTTITIPKKKDDI